MDIMKPIASPDIPHGDDWLYEVKYDGFRCVLQWEKDEIKLMSRNHKDLTDKFPEIINYCREKQDMLFDFLPLKLDGELVVLNHPYQANFPWIQKRGRLKSNESILKKSLKYILFELISLRHQIFFAKTLIQFWVLYSFLTSQVNQLSQTSKAITDLISSFIFLSVISQK